MMKTTAKWLPYNAPASQRFTLTRPVPPTADTWGLNYENAQIREYQTEQPDKLCDGLLLRRPHINSNRNFTKKGLW